MRRLLLHSTLVLVVLLLSAAASHAEQQKASALTEGRKTGSTNEEADLHDEGEEDEEGVDEAESEGTEQKNKPGGQGGPASRMILTNALQSSSLKDVESPEEAKKQREMALRVRELLSRLPIIPLSQSPVLHKETLVAAAPAVASGASDDAAAIASSTPTASPLAQSLVFRDPTIPVHGARIAALHPLDRNAFIPDEQTDERLQTAPPPVAPPPPTPLYVGRPGTQPFPVAFPAAEQVEYRVPELSLPYLERPDDVAETSGAMGAQPGKGYPSLADVSRGDLHIPEAQHISAPAEFVQLFGIMNALSTLVEWVDAMKQELNSRESDTRPIGGEDETEEKGGEEEAPEKEGGKENIKKKRGEDMTEEENVVEKTEGGFSALHLGHQKN